VQKKIFWALFTVLSLIADFELSFLWGLALTIPLLILCWWIAFRSGWFED
jgi:hypothetical protein